MLSLLHNEQECDVSELKLTPRGKEVFRLILSGCNDKQIGERLGISYSGVRRHKEKMLLANSCSTVLELISKHHESGQNQ